MNHVLLVALCNVLQAFVHSNPETAAMNQRRALRALARRGLHVEREGTSVFVRKIQSDAPPAEVLLPADHPLDGKALHQLASFAETRHPAGGVVHRACATPDFHAGSRVPVGCVLATSRDMVIPQAVGTDINCGMRMHVADLSVDALSSRRDEWLPKVRSDLLLGTRDLPMRVDQVRAMFRAGPLGWLDALRSSPLGMLARADLAQLEVELERSYGLGSLDGDDALAPADMLPDDRDVVRDCFMGTIGGGNHFVELQVVEEIFDRHWAFAWGVRAGQVAIMVHSGSRRVGVVVGGSWITEARELWPKESRHPANGIFALHGDAAKGYVKALGTAANYAAVNRLLLAELVRDRLRETFGRELEMPLVFDVPHNIVLEEDGQLVHRKGATPAHAGQPVLVPGSMGHASYLMVGLGNPRFVSSASHGAGRKLSRRQMHRVPDDQLGLTEVECITLKEERLIQEAPAAYKDIDDVVRVQAEAGVAKPVARMRPIMTFKG